MTIKSKAARIYEDMFCCEFEPCIPVAHIQTVDQLEAYRDELSAGEFDAIEAAILNL